jgi:hypothetical protein
MNFRIYKPDWVDWGQVDTTVKAVWLLRATDQGKRLILVCMISTDSLIELLGNIRAYLRYSRGRVEIIAQGAKTIIMICGSLLLVEDDENMCLNMQFRQDADVCRERVWEARCVHAWFWETRREAQGAAYVLARGNQGEASLVREAFLYALASNSISRSTFVKVGKLQPPLTSLRLRRVLEGRR